MVSTRGQQKALDQATDLTPSKAPRKTAFKGTSTWAHTTSKATLIWLLISLPLVTWDFSVSLTLLIGKYIYPGTFYSVENRDYRPIMASVFLAMNIVILYTGFHSRKLANSTSLMFILGSDF